MNIFSFNYIEQYQIPRVVKVWLLIGLIMITVQVVVGGITRLTGSGLSITKWEIVTGTLPPLNAKQWDEAFDLYKATPQYLEINQGMSMSDFKFIYFWEYIHRLWARGMGFVFAIPFFIFLFSGMLSRTLIKDLGIVILLAATVASFGWIMVASGLVDRPWVSAYKLTLHLSLAFILYSYLLWTTFKVFQPRPSLIHNPMLKKLGKVMLVVLGIQIFLGGIMSGMKAGVIYPTWPDMHGVAVPKLVFNSEEWNVDNLMNYESNLFAPALIQFLHRTSAYLLTAIVLWFFVKGIRSGMGSLFNISLYLLVSMLVIQVLLGIFTLINCQGTIPVGLGVFHQAGALFLLTITLFVYYQLRIAEK
ncbi:MAG: COX15/CtaA family protein [Bacteroidota bacterium]